MTGGRLQGQGTSGSPAESSVLQAVLDLLRSGVEQPHGREIAARSGIDFNSATDAALSLEKQGLLELKKLRGDDRIVSWRVVRLILTANSNSLDLEGTRQENTRTKKDVADEDKGNTRGLGQARRKGLRRILSIGGAISVALATMLGVAADIPSVFWPDGSAPTPTPPAVATIPTSETTLQTPTAPPSQLPPLKQQLTIPMGTSKTALDDRVRIGVTGVYDTWASLSITTPYSADSCHMDVGESTVAWQYAESPWFQVILLTVSEPDAPHRLVMVEVVSGTGTYPYSGANCS